MRENPPTESGRGILVAVKLSIVGAARIRNSLAIRLPAAMHPSPALSHPTGEAERRAAAPLTDEGNGHVTTRNRISLSRSHLISLKFNGSAPSKLPAGSAIVSRPNQMTRGSAIPLPGTGTKPNSTVLWRAGWIPSRSANRARIWCKCGPAPPVRLPAALVHRRDHPGRFIRELGRDGESLQPIW